MIVSHQNIMIILSAMSQVKLKNSQKISCEKCRPSQDSLGNLPASSAEGGEQLFSGLGLSD